MSQSSTTPKDGGPAFPILHQEDANGNVRQWGELGMTLRDYFAAKAMQAAMTRGPLPDSTQAMDGLARDSYHMADAMLRAREQS